MYKPALLTVKDVKNFILDAINELPSKVYTQKQMMEILGTCNPRMRQLIKNGMPHFMKGKRRFFRLSEVRSWLIQNNIRDNFKQEEFIKGDYIELA